MQIRKVVFSLPYINRGRVLYSPPCCNTISLLGLGKKNQYIAPFQISIDSENAEIDYFRCNEARISLVFYYVQQSYVIYCNVKN